MKNWKFLKEDERGQRAWKMGKEGTGEREQARESRRKESNLNAIFLVENGINSYMTKWINGLILIYTITWIKLLWSNQQGKFFLCNLKKIFFLMIIQKSNLIRKMTSTNTFENFINITKLKNRTQKRTYDS